MKQSDITLLLTVRNEQDYIGATIKSILGQTHKNFQFWIVDDGSTDATQKIIKSFNDSRITSWCFKENAGMTARLNWLVPQVTTTYIARMDSHHLAESARLQKQLDFLEGHPKIVALGSNFIRTNEAGKEISRSNFPQHYRRIKHDLMQKNVFRHSSMVFRTEIYKKVGLYNPYFKLAQDYDFILRVASHHQVENLPNHLITEVYRSSNMTQRFRTRSAWEALLAQWYALTRYDYPLWQSVYLLRGLAFLAKSYLLQKLTKL